MKDRRVQGEIIVDRRRASRLPVRFDVSYTLLDVEFEASARNLTRHGIFVETEEAIPDDAVLELRLYLPDGEASPAKVSAEVRRPARRREDVPGFGADFVALDAETAGRIRRVLAESGGLDAKRSD